MNNNNNNNNLQLRATIFLRAAIPPLPPDRNGASIKQKLAGFYSELRGKIKHSFQLLAIV